MGNISGLALGLMGGLFTLAIIAVIVSQRAQTGTVLTSAGQAISAVIGAAVGPVTGSTSNTFGAPATTVPGVTL